jgi:hypothetical protein
MDEVIKPLDDILRDWESGTMDAAGTIEDLVAIIDDQQEALDRIKDQSHDD